MRTVIQQGDIFGFAVSRHFCDRFGKKEQALAHDHELRRHLLDKLNGFLTINMVMVFSKWQIMEIDRVRPPQLERLTAHLDTPTKYSNSTVTDMPACIGRVCNDSISTPQPSQGNA